MTEQTAENFIFYNSFYEAIREFDDEKRLELYDAIMEFAFDNIEKEFIGMQNAVFSLIKPLISASIKNYQKGVKGGRPTTQRKPEQKEPFEEKYSPNCAEVDNFVEDYKIYKNSDFEPTELDRKQIAVILSELNGYEKKYWQKVFTLAKGGFDINGQIVPCNLKKILLEHNAIYAGELNLAPNKEYLEKVKQNKKQKKQAEEQEYRVQADAEREEREQERSEVQTAEDAVNFLNKYIHGNNTLKRVSSDYKEFKQMFENITLNEELGEYELCG